MSAADLRARAGEIVAALALLTRLPVGALAARLPVLEPARAVWAYPLAGAIVGAIGGGVYWLGASLGLPPALSAVWALAALILATGALHEDGVADFADGFGGTTRERRLEIMRDSRLGVYGALALALSLAVRAVALALLADPSFVLAGLVATGAASRACAGGLMAGLPNARADGLSAATGRPSATIAAIGFGIVVLIGIIVLEFGLIWALWLGAGLGALAVAWLAKRSLRGQTGDVLGAAVQAAECLALTALVAAA